ncbi:glycosyltransferase family 4 protein [Pseudoalteromonas sp. MMG013]|uniref:glycosyltransferase family 4 protein n=1 Tax=Pseudoalteromonas sp. MMG013 TaxID=2822687 RepID=UPI001B368888|nr:glycosyltransferase family 4 protein [Pseudoalteromonas sp. MMG013]
MKIIVIGTLPSSLYNFRGDLLRKMVAEGHDVIAMASNASKEDISKIEQLGVSYLDYDVQRSGLNPLKDIRTFIQLNKVIKLHNPHIILSYTIKPVIWGGIAARVNGVEGFIALITGLGFAFQEGGVKRRLLTSMVKKLYRFSLKKAQSVIFQNEDNRTTFIENTIVDKSKCYRVNGSGVNLSHYQKCALPKSPSFLLIARLLGEKGIREYFHAAEQVKRTHPEAVFGLVGPVDPSPDGISEEEVSTWHNKGVIDYKGATSDVRQFIAECNTFVLPSYHEGMPRTVLEAMAMSRPILTTNVPGCKETVVNGENGFLVPKGNVNDLAVRMSWLIDNADKLEEMGEKSYQMALDKFDVKKVNDDLFEIMELKR